MIHFCVPSRLRNTPDPDCGMSLAEIVFGQPLRDAFSFINRINKFSNRYIRRTWRETWRAKEDALHLRAKRSEKTYPTPGRFAVWRPRFRLKPNSNFPRKMGQSLGGWLKSYPLISM